MNNDELRAALALATQICKRAEANAADFATVRAKVEAWHRDGQDLCDQLKLLADDNRSTIASWKEMRDHYKYRLDESGETVA